MDQTTGEEGVAAPSRTAAAAAPEAAGAAPGPSWNVLQLSDVLDLEFATELAEGGPVVLWEPRRRALPFWPRSRAGARTEEGNLEIRSFPVQRGVARLPSGLLERLEPVPAARLLRRMGVEEGAVLVCTTPYFAAVAERWAGPVVYWLTDLMAAYEGIDPAKLRRLDRRLCRRADLVCPNSERIATYLREGAGCPAEKITVLPNATRARNTLPEPLFSAAPAPADLAGLEGPVAGVLGALGGNMDWVFLERLQVLAPWLSWAFVGPADLRVEEPAQRRARDVVRGRPNTVFTGAKPYGELYRYARGFTVGVLPYRHREPTYSGSSTRFYEHLAACHPMLATPGVAELLGKEPLLRLASTPEAGARLLETWREAAFDDGLRAVRWKASLQETWTERGIAMRGALAARMAAEPAPEAGNAISQGEPVPR